jgi:hypothetical protein
MPFRIKLEAAVLACVFLAGASCALAQQKGQWAPGQFGLNAGVIPDPGFTYGNLTMNYSASQLNDSNGNRILNNVTGTYGFWVNENIFYCVPSQKILGGHFAPYISVNVANGSLVADIPGTNLSVNGGGIGLADTYVQPVNLAWHFGKRVDFNAGYAFFVPTGRYTAGAKDNVGSGYWGNVQTSGTTYYITKNKGTTANLVTAWEFNHGLRQVASTPAGQFSNKTPGQTFTMEWGLGQALPLKKDFSMLAQLGVVGYDQWQVTDNGGTVIVAGIPAPASTIPRYTVHGIGVQSNLIMPPKGLVFFFKYYDEYSAKARPQGRTFVFGGSWTLRIPKPQPPKS